MNMVHKQWKKSQCHEALDLSMKLRRSCGILALVVLTNQLEGYVLMEALSFFTMSGSSLLLRFLFSQISVKDWNILEIILNKWDQRLLNLPSANQTLREKIPASRGLHRSEAKDEFNRTKCVVISQFVGVYIHVSKVVHPIPCNLKWNMLPSEVMVGSFKFINEMV